MASGVIRGPYYGGSSNTAYNMRLILKWSSTPNASTNSSTVNVDLYLSSSSIYCAGVIKYGTITIAGKSKSISKSIPTKIDNSSIWETYLGSHSTTVSHNSSGAGSASISASFAVNITYTNVYVGTMSVSGTANLGTINSRPNTPAGIAITGGVFEMGEKLYYKITPPSSGPTPTSYKIYIRYYNKVNDSYSNWLYSTTVTSLSNYVTWNSEVGWDGVRIAASAVANGLESTNRAESPWVFHEGMKVWNGSAWVYGKVNVWNGSAWTKGFLRVKNSSGSWEIPH